MVGPSARRKAVQSLVQERGYSQRQACALVDTPRSGLSYQTRRKPDEDTLRDEIRSLARKKKRYGCPRIHACLERKGWKVNKKRIHRIWKDEGLSLPQKRPRRRRRGPQIEIVNQALWPNHVWSYDFLQDRTERGGRLRCLPVLDEFSRECLAIDVASSIGANRVIANLQLLFTIRGVPGYIRSDNGPEFVAKAVQEWLAAKNCGTLFITPGSPWENAYIESFNGKFRDECLNREVFQSGREARQIIGQWRYEYNVLRPHSSLGKMTPSEFVAQWSGSCRATPSIRRTIVKNPTGVDSSHRNWSKEWG